jgi:23S rRNA (guanine745-N1)-methyltransferase
MHLLCTVRTCRMPLVKGGRTYVCANHHSYDIARSGYVNLLQPHDRRSAIPGDTADAVAARRRFLDAGHAAPLVRAIVDALPLNAGDALLDAGCGEGHHLGAFRAAYGVDAHGADISVAAIDAAARRDRDCTWVVANIDRFVPYEDHAFRAVTSITARLQPAEFHRVLAPDGTLLVAIAGANDLIELRAAILGARLERDRVERTVALFAPHFTLARHVHVEHLAHLDRAAMLDVMSSSYRGLRTRERERLEGLDEMDVTLSRDVLLFTPNAA